MKAIYVVVASAIFGAVLGAGMSWARFGNPPPFERSEVEAAVIAVHQERQPKVSVDERTHDFGPVDRDSKARHTFHITNAGNAPLKLSPGTTTCSRCTIAQLSKTELQPGETADVTVEYVPGTGKSIFRQTATVHTSDPNEKRVDLNIVGRVTSRYRVVPDELSFGKVSANETKTAELKIYSYLAPEVRVIRYDFSEGESADHFEVKSEPIPQDQLNEPLAKAGCLVTVSIKPGLPLGLIRQTIRLELALAGSVDTPVVEVHAYGRIDSDISIVGPKNWNPDIDRLAIGSVKSAQGGTGKVSLVLRGPKRQDVQFKLAKVDPPWLRFTLGDPVELKRDGSHESGVTQIPVTVEIPPGAPPANYLGTDLAPYGQIVLETTHPQVKQIRMNVQFAVEQ